MLPERLAHRAPALKEQVCRALPLERLAHHGSAFVAVQKAEPQMQHWQWAAE